MSRKNQQDILAPRQRNPFHDHPLLGKSDPHGKPRKSERRRIRVALRQRKYLDK